MSKTLDELILTLEKQTENYKTLKELVLEKRDAITANDLKTLSTVTSQVEAVVSENNHLESQRLELVNTLACELKLSESKPTLARIAEYFENPVSEKLLDLRNRASAAIKEVQRHTAINMEMLRYSADLMDSVLKRLLNADSEESTYGSTGTAKKKIAQPSLLDQQI